MEEMMRMNKETGESIPVPPPQHQPMELPDNMTIPSRKEMKASLLPKVGDRIGPYLVTYTNVGQFRFSAEGEPLPELDSMFELGDKVYQVSMVIPKKGRFNAIFKGFKQNPIADAPVEESEDLVKVI